MASQPSAQRLPPPSDAPATAKVFPFSGRRLEGGAPDPFADPLRPDPALEAFLQEAARRLSHWLGNAADRPLPAPAHPLPGLEPERRGLSAQRLLDDLQQLMEGAYAPGHPGALAHLDPPPLTAGIAAEMVCAGLNNNLLAEELSPGLSELERQLCGWFAGRLGLGERSGGIPASGGSLSNLMALVTARRQAGLATRGDAVVLCSADAHVSLDKAVAVMGLPPQALIRLPVDGAGGLDPQAVAERLGQLQREGVPAIALVATAGTTVRGAIDPLEPLAELCRSHRLWLHVDGAIGAVFALAPQIPGELAALGRADSLTVNPQKLLGVPKTSSLLLLRRPALLEEAFGTGLPYMEPSAGGAHGGEAGLQGTRPAEILKLWLGLRQLGLEGIAAVLEGSLERRRQLQELLEADGRLTLCSGPLHLIAFRPAAADPAAAERWSLRARQELLDQQLMLSRPLYQGRRHLKAVLGNPHTRSADLQRLAAVVRGSLDA
ncbi:MAG: pyridoxal phosphate-dependent decarboxylase family protein [Cyanobium sp.]